MLILKKILLIFYIISNTLTLAFSSPPSDSLNNKLKKELNNIEVYDNKKEAELNLIKGSLQRISADDKLTRYKLYSQLYNEYSSYRNDSASSYAQKMYILGEQMEDKILKVDSRIKIGNTLIAAGLFKETFEIIENIDAKSLPVNLKFDYYSLFIRTYFDLSNYDNDAKYTPKYRRLCNLYLDSTIALFNRGSDSYYQALYFKKYINNQFDAESEVYFLNLLRRNNLPIHQKAMISSTLSNYYQKIGMDEKAKNMLIQAAILDIRSSTKETLAIYKLSLLLYKKGDVENAYLYLNEALNEASFFGARQRQVQINSILPVVAAQKLAYSEKENKLFLVYLMSVIILASLLLLVTVQLFKQLKKLKLKEVIIEEANKELELLNNRLKEDAHIKEEYIGYFFDVLSEYIDKLEKIKLNIESKVMSHRYNEIIVVLNRIQVKKERENLFSTFDKVFLKIFPNFIESFNAMYREADQIWPKNGGLTIDIRICALMRLGIHDNAKISKILEYSEKTIYVYKARLKARSLYPLDQFEKKLMEIESVSSL